MQVKLLWLGALLWSSITIAQSKLPGNISFFDKGSYRVARYSDSIIRISFLPNGYTRNENPSDAVIMKGRHVLPDGVEIRDDSVFYRNRLFITGTHASAHYNGFRFQLHPHEKIFGGGERALPLNRHGYRLSLYNNPWYGYGEGADALNYSVPFITSSEGYGLFFDNASRGYIDIGKTTPGILEYGASSGELNVFILLGNYQQVLHQYHRLTGTQPLPPLWAMGNLMSRFGYSSATQVRSILDSMRQASIPVDAVIFDLFWFGDSIKGTMGNLDWVNRQAWPDPSGMIRDFKQKGIRTILITEPFLVEGSKYYQASKPFLAVDSLRKPYVLKDFYFGKGGLVDIFRKDAQDWFWKFYSRQMKNGVEAWWGDLGEPEKHPHDLYHDLRSYGYRRLFSADEVHNIYGHVWTKMLYNNYAKEYPSKRLFSLNRSGFAGSQRYGIYPWTGDVSRSWGGLRAQLPVLLGMSMSGVPYVHSDAGGFAGGEGDAELYVRWMQLAAFTPILRPHGTALYEKETAAFSYPSEAALIPPPYRDYAKSAIARRYQLLPYNYSLAYQHTTSGQPLMAPLYYYFEGDSIASKVEDQYMWGQHMMIVPVLEKAATSRKLYLPGGEWYRFGKNTFMEGGRWITEIVPLDDQLLFFRPGAFIPSTSAHMHHTGMFTGDSLEIYYIPSAQPSSFNLYQDDGETKQSLQRGHYQLVRLSSPGIQKNQLQIQLQPLHNYPGKRKLKHFTLRIPLKKEKPGSVWVNGKEYTYVPALHEKTRQRYTIMQQQLVIPAQLGNGSIDIRINW